MKTLILMRHAKSAWDDAAQSDSDRPLSPRGQEAAPRMGAWLAANRFRPELVLCSPARRAQETLDLVKPSLPKAATFKSSRDLYMATPREILNRLAKTAASIETVLVIGHNPGIGNLAAWLIRSPDSKGGDAKTIAALRAKYPTGAVAVLQFDFEQWSEIEGESGKLIAFMRPRDLT